MDCPPGAAEASARGNFVAIGTMLPGIEVWDLDLLDAVEPAAVLGDMMATAPQAPSKASKKKKKGKSGGAAPAAEAEPTSEAVDSHTGAVMALAWNGASLLSHASPAWLTPRVVPCGSRVPQRLGLRLG